MSSFWDTLTGIFDIALSPSCAQDPASDAAAGEDPAWHNSFGTAADYQVPAEVDYAYSSIDSCGWSSGGGFDSGGGSGMDF